jgi:RNA polymerase sigma-70 factor, ECF subfamily
MAYCDHCATDHLTPKPRTAERFAHLVHRTTLFLCLEAAGIWRAISMGEDELVAAARAGDQDAFAELYRRHQGYVRAIGRSILRTDDLDDMCQETFLSAFTRLETFQGNAVFRTWLSRIALNRCLAILRNAKRTGRKEVDMSALEDAFPQSRCKVDQQLERIPERLDVERRLILLTPAQREALELAYVEEMPAHEIARLLDTTVTAIRGRIATAKKKLKTLGKQ